MNADFTAMVLVRISQLYQEWEARGERTIFPRGGR